jgi:CheY-like chemotaxis protein
MSRIAIIEDDALMRALMAEWLTAGGHQIVESAPAASAASPVDLVIVDVYMPRNLGAEALCLARAAYPGAPIIAISGQFHPGLRCAGPAAEALGVERVMAKPFDREALLEAVRSILATTRRRSTDAKHAAAD